MRIESITLCNTGVFTKTQITFERDVPSDCAEIHIITGNNGSGKTTLLQALASGFHYVNEDNAKCPFANNNLHKKFRGFKKNKGGQYESYVDIKLSDGAQITSYGCPDCLTLHIKTKSVSIRDYRKQLAVAGTPNYKFAFAVFCYSGYRMLKSPQTIVDSNYNPLFDSLEFIKEENPHYSTTNWIIQTLLKESYSEKNKLTVYNGIITQIEQAISEIIGYNIQFELTLLPTKLYFCYNNGKYETDSLPDGLRSLITWIADLCIRLEALQWKDDTPLFERSIILLLDEIEVHLHPKWQRKVLPTLQKMFPNAQIFVSTHSPFVVNSVNNAFVYKLVYDNNSQPTPSIEIVKSHTNHSYQTVLSAIFNVDEDFGLETQKQLDLFYKYRNELEQDNIQNIAEFLKYKKLLSNTGAVEISSIVEFETRQLRRLKPNLAI